MPWSGFWAPASDGCACWKSKSKDKKQKSKKQKENIKPWRLGKAKLWRIAGLASLASCLTLTVCLSDRAEEFVNGLSLRRDVMRVGVWLRARHPGYGPLDHLGPRVIARLPSLAAGSTDIVTPVLFANDGGRAPSLRLDVLGAPGLDEVVVVLAAQLLVDVIAHGGM
jgi:hypothetical protein